MLDQQEMFGGREVPRPIVTRQQWQAEGREGEGILAFVTGGPMSRGACPFLHQRN